MNSVFSAQRKKDENGNLPKVESFLETTYKPVSPNEDFVANLKHKLADPDYHPPSTVSNVNLLLFVGFAISTTVLVGIGIVKLVSLIAETLRVVDLFKPPLQAGSSSTPELPTTN